MKTCKMAVVDFDAGIAASAVVDVANDNHQLLLQGP
uniref:Uncharacterized protein n=1 Tax=Rhizophora mucronata TaxID=61149 RepID=A0A2P2Q1A7_RHIMU